MYNMVDEQLTVLFACLTFFSVTEAIVYDYHPKIKSYQTYDPRVLTHYPSHQYGGDYHHNGDSYYDNGHYGKPQLYENSYGSEGAYNTNSGYGGGSPSYGYDPPLVSHGSYSPPKRVYSAPVDYAPKLSNAYQQASAYKPALPSYYNPKPYSNSQRMSSTFHPQVIYQRGGLTYQQAQKQLRDAVARPQLSSRSLTGFQQPTRRTSLSYASVNSPHVVQPSSVSSHNVLMSPSLSHLPGHINYPKAGQFASTYPHQASLLGNRLLLQKTKELTAKEYDHSAHTAPLREQQQQQNNEIYEASLVDTKASSDYGKIFSKK